MVLNPEISRNYYLFKQPRRILLNFNENVG